MRCKMEKQGKKIAELRVVDLRQILEKRGLEKAGNKSVLVERLSKSLQDDGLDPNVYVHTFDDGDNAANDSIVSETSQTDEAADASESKETLNEETADICDEEAKGTELNATERSGEDLSFQDGDKMLEVDSLATDQTSNYTSQEEQPEEADSGACTTKEEDVLVENANTDTDHNVQAENTDHAEIEEGDDADTADGEAEDCSTPLDEPSTAEVVADTATDPEEVAVVTAGSVARELSSKPADTAAGSAMDTDGTFVVHIDESDTNLDYDIKEERDAPTPTKDESMDVDASDIVPSDGSSAPVKQQSETDAKGATTTSSQASKSSADTRTDTPKKDAKDLAASQNLWISGLSSLTRATDLKAVFSKHGKVIGAKVVTNANRPGAKCYGYVTMSSSEEAAKCIQHLHRTELHSRMISVEKAKSDPAAQARAAAARKPAADADKKKEEATSSTSQEAGAAAKEESSGGSNRITTTSHRSDDKSRHSDRHRPRSTGPSTAKKDGEGVKDGEKKPEEKKEKSEAERKADEYIEREKRRVRLLERRMRDDDYRRRNVLLKEKRDLAEQQRRMRMDEERLNREREKLRIDREKVRIEEMKLESLQGERSRLENQLIELRQRVDREREELKRVETLRLEEMRRSTAVKRSYDSSNASRGSGGGRYDDGWESKRPASNDRYTAMSVDRRGSATVTNDRGGYSDRRPTSDMDRRTGSVKEVAVERGSGRSDERYTSRAGGAGGGERRDYGQADSRSRDVSSRSVSDSRGVSRNYHDGTSSRRSGGGSGGERQSGWSGGSSGPPSLLAGPSNELFSGAAVQAAGMMMSAAMSRGGSGATNGTSSRYSGGGGGGGGGSSYGGARRY